MEEMKNNNQVPENNDNAQESVETQGTGNDKKKAEKSVQREILEWVQAIVIAVVLALVVRTFVFTVVRVDGASMEPTLQNNDRMIVWRLGYEPKAGDIVVFKSQATNNDHWIKRVIATEGQTVKIDYKTNSVFVDGEKMTNIREMARWIDAQEV
jgi:signal peptidase I